MRIRIGTGYFGLTTMPSPMKAGSAKSSQRYFEALNTPPEKRPQVILVDESKASEPAMPVMAELPKT